jgi:hypothetical protein
MKVRFIYTYNNRPAINVFYLSFTGSIPDLATMAAILTQIQTNWAATVRTLQVAACVLNAIEGTDLTTRTGIVASNLTGGAGTATTVAPYPNSVAMCVSFPVATRYRGGHSRMYLPGQDGSHGLTGTNWTAAWLVAVGAAMSTFRASLNAMTGANAPFALVQVSYFEHNAAHEPIYHPGGPIVRPITGVLVHSRIDSQRRRLGKETT